MKFLVVGDVHANIRLFAELVNKTDCDAVLQCGDLGIWSLKDFTSWGFVEDKHGHYEVYNTMAPITDVTNLKVVFDKPVFFIKGNHENFDLFDIMHKNGEFDGRYNLNYVAYDKPAVVKNGKETIRVSGLSGCYSYKVYTGGLQKNRRIKVKPETPASVEEYLNNVLGKDPRGRFKASEVAVLRNQKSDILLLHEIPMGISMDSILPVKNDTGCSALNEVIEEMQPKYVFVGHWHRKREVEMGRSKVISLPDIMKSGWLVLDTKTQEIVWGGENGT
jgi:uncharacterized protein